MTSAEEQREIQDCIRKLTSPELYEKEYALRILINYAVDGMFYFVSYNFVEICIKGYIKLL